MIARFTFDVPPSAARVNDWKTCLCRGGRPRMVLSKAYREAHESLRVSASMQACDQGKTPSGPLIPTGPVAVEIVFRPDRVHRKGPAAELAQLDADAPIKCVLDALQGSAYTDDAQVVRVVSTKTTDKTRPHFVVTVSRCEVSDDG